MKKTIIDIAVLLVAAHVINEAASVVEFFNKKWAYTESDWFISPDFHMKMANIYYVKYPTENILWIATYYVLAKVCFNFSGKLFLIAVILFFFHILSFVMFWWDFNTSHWLYWVSIAEIIICVVSILYPFKEDTLCKIKSLF